MDREWEWERGECLVRRVVHRSCISERGLYTCDNHRLEVHLRLSSIRTELLVEDSYHTPLQPFFVLERVP